MSEQLALLPGYLSAHLRLTLGALLAGTLIAVPAGVLVSRAPTPRRGHPGACGRRAGDPGARAARRDGAVALRPRPAGHRHSARLPRPRPLQPAADPPEHGDRPARHRPGGGRGGAGRGHDAPPASRSGRAAAGAAGGLRRSSHRDRLDRRHGHPLDACRRAKPRQLHLRRPPDPQHRSDPDGVCRRGIARAAARRPRARDRPGGRRTPASQRCSRRCSRCWPSPAGRGLPARTAVRAAAPSSSARRRSRNSTSSRRCSRTPSGCGRAARRGPSSSLGSTVAFDALRRDEIDLYVDYTGTLWATVMGRQGTGGSRRGVMEEVRRWLSAEYGITLVASLGFENAYCFAVRRETAERLRLARLSDLARHAPRPVARERLRVLRAGGVARRRNPRTASPSASSGRWTLRCSTRRSERVRST